MNPIHLNMKNFMCHKDSNINFDFESALIVGKINNNLDISNGSGKSTIFNAIEYVLFNECGDLKLEKIIKDGESSCHVEFIFELDQNKFKIKRSRSAKGTSSVQVYKFLTLNGEDSWKDLSGRRNSDTEDQIKKIIKINSKSFRNTTHFAQRDFSGLTTLTPTKRKEVLKEIFDLSFYSKLEKIANSKLNYLNKDLLKTETIIDSLGNPNELLNLEKSNLEKNIFEQNSLKNISTNLKEKKNNVSLDKEKISLQLNKYSEVESLKTNLKNDILNIDKKINIDLENKNNLIKKIEELKKSLTVIPKQDESIDNKILEIKKKILNDSNALATLTAERSSLNKEILKLQSASSMKVCESCMQDVSNEHCEKIKDNLKLSLQAREIADSKIDNLNLELKKNSQKEKEFLRIKESQTSDIRNINVVENNINIIYNNISNIENRIKELEITKENLLSKFEVLPKTTNNFDSLKNDYLNIQNLEKSLDKEIENNNNLLSKLSKESSVLEYKINELTLNISKLESLSKDLLKIKEELKIYPLIAEAFSSKGIPSFIINNLLDEVQLTANNFCNKIKPGLQLQFLLQKENSSGNEVETLDIKYFLNGQEREFDQLSGAMKFNVTFSLKLSLSIIIQKILGININFFLFDEIDSSLDKFSSNEFVKVVKELQKTHKILLITHGDYLKDKFNTKILVNQDINGSSTIIQD